MEGASAAESTTVGGGTAPDGATPPHPAMTAAPRTTQATRLERRVTDTCIEDEGWLVRGLLEQTGQVALRIGEEGDNRIGRDLGHFHHHLGAGLDGLVQVGLRVVDLDVDRHASVALADPAADAG